MTLEDFKDAYKDAPLLTKLNLLIEVQSRRADAQAIAATERWNENAEAERHWVNEHRSASAKATWLFEGLKKALKALEPCEDAVSKQTVISALEGEYSDWNDDYNIPITHCIKAVQSIPSVQPVPVARVMSLEEVRQFVYGSPYIIETNLPCDEPRLMWGLYSHQGVSGNFDFAITDGRKRLFDADYGKTWRCWTQRPTKEQREATPWET